MKKRASGLAEEFVANLWRIFKKQPLFCPRS